MASNEGGKHAAAWERAYSKKRIAWRGTTNFSPELPKGSKILEVGCGNGKNLSALTGKGFRVYAVDYSPQAIALCKASPQFNGGKEKKIVFRVMDARSLEFKDGFFDCVVCFHVLGNMLADDRVKAASEASRVLKRGGKLFFKEFGCRDFRFGKGVEVEESSFKRRTGIVTHYFTGREEVAELFAGLDLTSFDSERWNVHYDGKTLEREEIHAVFIKPQRNA
jgi:SAM-dependent methyltransferase